MSDTPEPRIVSTSNPRDAVRRAILTTFLSTLNEGLQADPVAVSTLVDTRVACNDALTEHPDITVVPGPDGDCSVGLMGVLNGVCKRLTGHYIVAVADVDSGKIEKFVSI